MRLDKHPILMQGYEVMQAIEMCGCSIECTKAVTMAGELLDEVEKLVDLLIEPKENNYAKYKCNKCGKIVMRQLGWKVWSPSYCEEKDMYARLYRISSPVFNKEGI